MATTISREQYLAAQGLFAMAKSHAEKADELIEAFADLYGENVRDRVSDAIFGGHPIATINDIFEAEAVNVRSAD